MKFKLSILLILIVFLISACDDIETPTTPQTSTPTVKKPEYDLEMTMEEIVNTFSELSEIQQEEKLKELKGKRIKTSIYASKISKASLSTQYVVMEMYEYPYNLIAYAKAFFPAEEKDNLLKANIGDTIIFSGEFVSYRERAFTSTIEFTKSKFIGIVGSLLEENPSVESEKQQYSWLDLCLNAAKECKTSERNLFREGCYNYYSLNRARLNVSDSSYLNYINYLKEAFDCE